MVILSQEFYYYTTGSTRFRKSLKYYYRVGGNGTVEVAQIIKDGQMDPNRGHISALPSINVTPKQYKELENKLIG
jgi:hypothetical protein